MTTDEIRAELRRSAVEDGFPYWDVAEDAFNAMREWADRPMIGMLTDDRRTFYLLVAEAL